MRFNLSSESIRLHLRRIAIVVLPAILCVGGWTFQAGASSPQETLLSLLSQMEATYSQVNDYVTIFHKQELGFRANFRMRKPSR